MVKRTQVLTWVCLGILLLVWGCLGSKLEGPAIRFDTELFIFDEISAGTALPFSFHFTNPGTATLFILDLHTSCPCITVKAYDRITEAGGRGKITGMIHPVNLQGDLNQTITVETHLPEIKPVLTLEGRIYSWKD